MNVLLVNADQGASAAYKTRGTSIESLHPKNVRYMDSETVVEKVCLVGDFGERNIICSEVSGGIDQT